MFQKSVKSELKDKSSQEKFIETTLKETELNYMKYKRAAIRYAKALMQLSIEKNCLQATYKDMLLLDSVCKENKDLRLLLSSPIVNSKKKLEILTQIFDSKTSDLTKTYISIITNKKREALIPEISESFISQYKRYSNIQEATIITSTKISQKTKDKVVKYIQAQGAKKVELLEVINEKIIGGAIIRIEDKQLDLSISNEISKLRKTFNKNTYS